VLKWKIVCYAINKQNFTCIYEDRKISYHEQVSSHVPRFTKSINF